MSGMRYSTVVLPGGYFDQHGERHRDASMRTLSVSDEEWAAAVPPSEPQAAFVTELLSRVVRSVGPFRAMPPVIRDLLVADREYLLLQLIAASFGGHVETTLVCADPQCVARMDASFDIGQGPVHAGQVAASYRLAGTDVLFRLPKGIDQEEVASARLGPEDAVRRLLERCIVKPGGPQPEDAAFWDRLAEEMTTVVPRIDFEIEAACPECGHVVSHKIDPAAWFVGELSRRHAAFESEMHLLAFHYHWPLRELLGLSCERRSRWARLLSCALDRQPYASYV